MLSMLHHHRKIQLPVLTALLLLACDKDKRKKGQSDDTGEAADTAPDTDPACDTGHLDDDGECVPAACGTGTWGKLEVDESTVYVDIAAAEGGDGSEAAPFTPIQAGLDAAGDAGGGMVAVAAGTYPETLELGYAHDGVHLAGRCKELVVIDASAGDEWTPGIEVDARSSELVISGVTVSGSHDIGLLVGAGTLTFRESTVLGSEYIGIEACQSGLYETSLVVESCDVSGNTAVGVLIVESGATATLRETTIRGTRPKDNGENGSGIQVSGGANLTAEECEVSGNAAAGIVAVESGTAVTLRETAIQDTQPNGNGDFGFGIDVFGGASLTAEDCEVSGNTTIGVFANEPGTTVTLQETTILDTQPNEGRTGYGIEVSDSASLTAEDCEVSGSTPIGVVAADSGTLVTLRETTILDTQSDENGFFGYGIEVYGGASLTAEDCEVSGNTAVGVLAANAGTMVNLHETTIHDTQANVDGKSGFGIQVSGGASLEAETCKVVGNTEVGVLAQDSDSTVSLRETIVQGTQPNGFEEGGNGIEVSGGASLDAEDCEVSGNTAVGVSVGGDDCVVILRETRIRDTLPNKNGDGGWGVNIFGGASLYAEACKVSGNTAIGVSASHPGTSVVLQETTIEDTRPDENCMLGYGIQVSEGASLDAEACEVWENNGTGVLASYSGTSVTLRDTRIASTMRGEIATVGIGISAQYSASVVATGIEVSSNEGPGFYAYYGDTYLTCSGCVVQDNQFAGAVVIGGASLDITDSLIEGASEQENLGGGVGIYALSTSGGPPTLSVTSTTLQDNAIAGIWLSGQGSYTLSENTIHGGEGWSRENLTKCGDVVYAREAVTAWDGSAGLLLENNELLDGLGAGLFLDNATATLSGNSYADNAVDLVVQGEDCATPPDGYEDEALGSLELCPAYDYATCGDEFALYLELADPELGHGAALMRPGLPGPGELHLPALPVALPHAFEPPLLLPSAPRIEPHEFRSQPLRRERTPPKLPVLPSTQ